MSLETKTTPEKKRKPNTHLNSAQKAEAIALWKSGAVTLADLEAKFKKDRTTFIRLFKDAGVEKGESKEEVSKKIQASVESSLIGDASQLAERIRNTKEEHYKMASSLARIAWTMLADAKKNNKPIGTLQGDMRSLQMAAQVLKITREERYIVLGVKAEDDNEDRPLPELTVQELTAEDIKRMHAEQLQQTADELGLNEIEDLGDEAVVDEIEDDRVETDD